MMMMLPFLAASCALPGPGSGASHHYHVKSDKLKKKGKNKQQQNVESSPVSNGQHGPTHTQVSKPSPMLFRLNTIEVEVETKFRRFSHLTMTDFASFAEFRRWGRKVQSQCTTIMRFESSSGCVFFPKVDFPLQVWLY